MDKYIVAIGGGEIRQNKTFAIDKQIVALAKKSHPKLLFIPTASDDSENYIRAINKLYGDKLKCDVNSLCLLDVKTDKTDIKNKIFSADIIYVGGGNTLKMMKLWRKLGVDEFLKSAYKKGIILCGMSAGSICWFEYGHSDSMSFYNPSDWEYIKVKGIGLLKGIHCPHFDGQTRGIKRKKSFSQMIQKVGGHGIAIDNNAAIIFCNNTFKVINTKDGYGAYKIFKKDSKVSSVPLKARNEFTSLQELYSRTV